MKNIFQGPWGLVDIETTGLSAEDEQIIDLGAVFFQGNEFEGELQSCFRLDKDQQLPPLITKLTGINDSDLKDAPSWASWLPKHKEKLSRPLIAHNAEFEEKFLRAAGVSGVQWLDSQYALLFSVPCPENIKLERFIKKWGIRDKECHRGLEDSWDLLRVLCHEAIFWHKYPEKRKELLTMMARRQGLDWWVLQWLQQEQPVLETYLDYCAQHSAALTPSKKETQQQAQQSGRVSKTFSGDLQFSGAELERLLGEDDVFQQTFPNYALRPQQVTMAKKIGQSFAHNLHTYIQAPTGTGKTLGYLLPSFIFALAKSERVLLTTGTKALQKQLFEKDLPRFLALFPESRRAPVAMLVGAQNHFCALKFFDRLDDLASDIVARPGLSHLFFEFVLFLNRMFYDNPLSEQRSAPLVVGDIPYALYQLDDNARAEEQRSTLGSSRCLREECSYRFSCSYYQGQKQAQKASIVVANHSLVFQWPSAIERPQYLILDEGHRLEHEATEQTALQFGQKDWDFLLQGLEKQIPFRGWFSYLSAKNREKEKSELQQTLSQFATKYQADFFILVGLIQQGAQQSRFYSEHFWNEESADLESGHWDEIRGKAEHRVDRLAEFLLNLQRTLSPICDELLTIRPKQVQEFGLSSVEDFCLFTERVCACWHSFRTKRDKLACSFAYHQELGLEIRVKAIDIGEVIHESVYKQFTSVILTSATLGDAQGEVGIEGLEWSIGQKHLSPEKRFFRGLFLEEPFDVASSCSVSLITDGPSFKEPSFIPFFAEQIILGAEQIGGKTLVLCSSRARFDQLMKILLEKYSDRFEFFFQGMGPDPIQEFLNSERGIILGLESFGEGIDLPGDSLQLVFIDKVPDLRMDYVTQRRRDFYQQQFGQEFVEYYLNHRARKLRQKFGRLLRTPTDTGRIIVYDARLARWKWRTKGNLFDLLRPYQIQERRASDAFALE